MFPGGSLLVSESPLEPVRELTLPVSGIDIH